MTKERFRFEGRWDSQTWSLGVGELAGIHVRVHYTLPLLALSFVGMYWPDLRLALLVGLALLLLVFLHELGHCFGCRAVGGRADEVLLWPLGGLAYVQPPNRPFEHMITTIAGPAVNAVLLLLLLPALYFQGILVASVFNPFHGIEAQYEGPRLWTSVFFAINYDLLLLNVCLPFFPLDGGRLLHTVLWHRFDYYHATMLSTNVGLVGGGLLTLTGVYLAGAWGNDYLLLCCIGVYCIVESWRFRRQIELLGQMPDSEFGYDFSQGYASLEQSVPKLGRSSVLAILRGKWANWIRRRRDRSVAQLEEELDRILEKIHQTGMASLTREEKRTLTEVSRRRKASP